MKLIRWIWRDVAYESWVLLGLETFVIGTLGYVFVKMIGG